MLQVKLRDYFEQLATKVEAGEYAVAIRGLHQVLQQYPRFVAGYLLLGHALAGQGEYQEAVQQFRRVLGADPESVPAHVGLANSFRHLEDWDKAAQHLQHASELSPQDSKLRQEYRQLLNATVGDTSHSSDITPAALGRIYFTNRLYAKAIREMQSVLEDTPERGDVQVSLVDVLWHNGQQLDAVQLCQEILGRLPLALKPNLILAAAWLDSPQPHAAGPYLELAHSLDPLGLVSNAFLPDNAWWSPDAEISLPDDERDGLSSPQEVEQMSDRNRDDYEVPDWLDGVGDELLGDDQPESPHPAETPADESLPDWLQDLVTLGETDEGSTPLAELPEEMEPEEEPTLIVGTAAEDVVEEASDMPDWLSDIRAGMAEETTDASPQSAIAPLEAEIDTGGLPDWLQDTEPAEETDTARRDAHDVLPEWLQDEEDIEVTDDSTEMTQLPEWLREEEIREETEPTDIFPQPLPEERAFDEVESGVFQGLDFEELESREETIRVEEPSPTGEDEIPVWLTSEEGPTNVRLTDTDEPELEAAGIDVEAEAEVPDWLSELQQSVASATEYSAELPEAELPEEFMTEEETEDAEMPMWLRQMQEGAVDEPFLEEEDFGDAQLSETLLAAVEEAAVGEEDMVALEVQTDEPFLEEASLDAAWDDTISQIEEPVLEAEIAPETELVAVEAVEEPESGIDEVEAALEREARDAVEIAELPKEAEERLQVARQAATGGNWSHALAIYDGLVGSSELLDKVIDDLEVSIQSHPDDTAAYQLLGDAYMKDGRLPSALKTYRKALAKLYQ